MNRRQFCECGQRTGPHSVGGELVCERCFYLYRRSLRTHEDDVTEYSRPTPVPNLEARRFCVDDATKRKLFVEYGVDLF